MSAPDWPEIIWARIDGRFKDNPELVARLRAQHTEGSIIEILFFAALPRHLHETGLDEMIERVAVTDIEREDAGEPPLPKIEFKVAPEEAWTLVDRVIDRMVEEALGLRAAVPDEHDELARWAYRQATGREWIDEEEGPTG